MTPEEIRAEVDTLPSVPFGPNAKATLRYLMQSQSLSLTDAVLEFERQVAEYGEVYARQGLRAKKGEA